MREVLGEIDVDSGGERLVCKALDPRTRAGLISLLKKIAPETRFTADGQFFLLDIRIAMSLRSQREALPLRWSVEAATWIDTFAATYAHRPAARRRLLSLHQAGVAEQALQDYPKRSSLDPHQLIAVAAMTDRHISGICLFDEQGVGKTVMAVHAYDRLATMGEIDALLVFAPKNMLEEWKKDFHTFMGDRYAVRTITGSRDEKYDELMSRGDVYITNYETANVFEQPLRSFLLRKRGRVVLVVDESFFVKNRDARRSASVRRLRPFCNRCWVLCGTPAPNHALDVVHQFDIADGGVTFAGVKLPKEPTELRSTIKETVEQKGVYLRRLKRDVLPELPNKQFEQVLIPMEQEQRRMYGEALRRLVSDVEGVDDITFKKHSTSFLARRMALFEICSHPGQVATSYSGVPAKHSALDQILEEWVKRKREKVVLWSFFRYSLDHLFTRYEKFNPVRLDGTVADTKARAEAIRRFQEDDETMLFIANPAAGAAGITLTRSRLAIYESFSVQTAHYLQSVDRIHRRGQTRAPLYYVLLCKDSIEEEEYDRLLAKERLSVELFGDPLPETMTKAIFLHELIGSLKKLG